MSASISALKVECASCTHEAVVDMRAVEAALAGEPLSLKNIASLIGLLRCKTCGKRNVRVYDERGRLLFDSENLTPCVTCGEPISLPRLSAQPDAAFCLRCAEEGETEPAPPPYPQPPAEFNVCPRCDSKTVMRQNSESHGWFIGCSAFPRCRWTEEAPKG